MEIWHYWIICGILLWIWEIFTPGFVVGVFGLGCFAGGLASILGTSLNWQIAVFALMCLAGFVFIRPFFLRYMDKGDKSAGIGVKALIGKQAVVIKAPKGSDKAARVKLGGEEWRALAKDGSELFLEQRVIVQAVEGVTLMVESATQKETKENGS
jgi:membrane protein implicated in regulation of membrane protease activity